MVVTQIDTVNKGVFQAKDNEIVAGEMTYSWAGKDKIIIDHTEVNPKFSGKGVGKLMLMEAVKFAREKKIKILPLCPFAKSVFIKTEGIRDVLFNN